VGKRKRITKKGLKHDALLETAAKSTKFVEHHMNKVLIAAVALIAVVAIVTLVSRSRRATELAASAALITAGQTLSSAQIDMAAQQYQDVIDQYPGTRSAGAAVCYLGTINYHQEKYEEALQHFDEYLARYGGSGNLRLVALEGKAAILEQRRDFAAAAELYDQLASESSDVASAAARNLLNAARCYRSAGDWTAVRDTAARILDEHAGTNHDADARLYLAEAEALLDAS